MEKPPEGEDFEKLEEETLEVLHPTRWKTGGQIWREIGDLWEQRDTLKVRRKLSALMGDPAGPRTMVHVVLTRLHARGLVDRRPHQPDVDRDNAVKKARSLGLGKAKGLPVRMEYKLSESGVRVKSRLAATGSQTRSGEEPEPQGI